MYCKTNALPKEDEKRSRQPNKYLVKDTDQT